MPWLPHHNFVVTDGAAAPGDWLLLLHGIFGSGANLRTLARRLVAARPDWGVVLVDLRLHGESQGAPPPHTLAAAAGDVVALIDELGRGGRRVAALAGHSFGGKVALELCAGAGERLGLGHVWTLDSSPRADPGELDPARWTPTSPRGVLAVLAGLPEGFARRDDFTAALRARGISEGTAAWLAMNLAPSGDRLRLRLDPAALGDLLADYFQHDLWHVLERPPPGCAIHVVVAGRSAAWSAADRARVEALAAASPTVSVEVLAGAGHWVHTEALVELVQLMVARLG